jgi:hypothetical protein
MGLFLLVGLKTPTLVEIVTKGNADKKSDDIGENIMQRKQANRK